MMLLPNRTWDAIVQQLQNMKLHRRGPQKNYRLICEEHKPRIVLAQAFPAERVFNG